MADFRKLFYALAMVALVIGLTVPASAQSSTIVVCTASTVPTLDRAEGYAELVGDYTMVCQGGTPTAAGQPVSPVNITVFLTTNVTSKITAGGLYNEALLLVDEPNTPVSGSNPILNCGNTGATDNTISGPGVCGIVSDGTPADTYNGSAGHPNVFQGRLGVAQNTGQNSIVVFAGVPFDPPGTATVRRLRITNIRADAEFTGVASTFAQAQIQMNVSFTNATFVTIPNPQQIVAYVQHGLTVVSDSHGGTYKNNLGFLQCISENPKLIGGTNGTITTYTDTPQPIVRFQEGFNNAWKPKNINQMLTYGAFTSGAWTYAGAALPTYPSDVAQNVPGANYNTESGFEWVGATAASATGTTPVPVPNPPLGVGSTITSGGMGYALWDSTTNIQAAGVATQGTRLALAFANIPNGASLWLDPVLYLYRQNDSSGSSYPTFNGAHNTGVMVLTSTDANGDTAFSPASSTATTAANGNLVQVSNNLAVYEILFADPDSLEQVDVPVVVSYVSNLAANPPVGLPVTGAPATVAGGFAPFYSTTTARQPSSTLPVPRFIPGTTPLNIVEITKCACDLLFPYVASAGGFDTGLAIANTSLDPGSTFGFGATPQQGAVQFWYYGTIVGGGATPGSQTSNVVPAGGVLTYVLSNGGGAINSSAGSTATGLSGVPGLVGYIIAQAGFQYCHSFAYISALGAGPTGNGISEGYLGIVLDNPLLGIAGQNMLTRTTQAAENEGH